MITAARRPPPVIVAALMKGPCRLFLTEHVFVNFVLQDDYELPPPYRDYTRMVCDESFFGMRCWVDDVVSS